MKKLLLIVLIFVSLLANAQSSKQRLEDIESKLDSIREEQEWQDFRNKVERNRNDNQNTSKFLANPARYKLMLSTSNMDVWFDEKFYEKTKNNSFNFKIEIEYRKLQKLDDGTPYQYSLFSGSLYCKQNHVFISLAIFRSDINGQGESGGSQGFKISSNSVWNDLKKYRCS